MDGEHWTELPRENMPAALPREGAFAASNSALCMDGKDIYFGTGGPAARLFASHDFDRTWTVAETPIVSGNASSGIFSLFCDEKDDRRGRRELSGSGASLQECRGIQGWREDLGTCDATARRLSISDRKIQWRICGGWAHGCGDKCGWLALEFYRQSEFQRVRVSLSRQCGLGCRTTWNRSAVSGSDEISDLTERRLRARTVARWRGRRRK
jgi:hypothetical protein